MNGLCGDAMHRHSMNNRSNAVESCSAPSYQETDIRHKMKRPHVQSKDQKFGSGKRLTIAAFLSVLAQGVIPSASAEAYVNQLSQDMSGPAYIEQMPQDARPQPAPAKSRKPAAASKATAITGKPTGNRQPALPTVGAGVAMVLVAPAGDNQFPSVGEGTVNR
jgi:hypothetical protein